MVRGRQDSRRRGELRAGHLSANGARGYLHLRIIANPLGLSHIAARHHIEMAVVLAEPDGRGNRDSGLAKCREGDVFLIVNGGWNLAGHGDIVSIEPGECMVSLGMVAGTPGRDLPAGMIGMVLPALLPSRHMCYKPEHA